MNRHEEEWARSFNGKNETEILTAPLPPNLTDEQCFRFRSIQRDAGAAARQTMAQTEESALVRSAMGQLAVAARLQRAAEPVVVSPDASEPESGRQLARQEPPLPFAIPTGKTDALLDKQIASCAGIIEHLAHFIARYDSAVETCNQFMDRISVMMRSSAEAAIAAGRLRGMEPEGRRRR